MSGFNNKWSWELAKEGRFCDLQIVEKGGGLFTAKYSVHKLIMYMASPYFRTYFDTEMQGGNTDKITITTEATTIGLLELVLEAIYSTPARAERLYYNFVDEHHFDQVMALFMVCDFLQLDEHQQYLEKALDEFTNINDIVSWWRNRQENGQEAPKRIENTVQSHLRKSVKYIGHHNEAYISVDTLLTLWPKSDYENDINNQIHTLLNSIHNVGEDINVTGQDDPNEWMSAEYKYEFNQENILQATNDHPKLHCFDVNLDLWVDADTKYIFKRKRGTWYVSGILDMESQLIGSLTVRDRTAIRARGWYLTARRPNLRQVTPPDAESDYEDSD